MEGATLMIWHDSKQFYLEPVTCHSIDDAFELAKLIDHERATVQVNVECPYGEDGWHELPSPECPIKGHHRSPWANVA